MNIEKKKGLLMRDFGLESSDFFIDRKTNREVDLMIIRKTGIIKIQQKLNIEVKLKSLDVIPYGSKAMAVAIVEANIIDNRGQLDTIIVEGEASPDNCTTSFGYYCATAKKRAESRATLLLADLTKLDMHGEIEAEGFKSAGRGVEALEQTIDKAKDTYTKGKDG